MKESGTVKRSRIAGGAGGLLAVVGLAMLALAVLSAPGSPATPAAQAQQPQPALAITKSSQGFHQGGPFDGAREYRLTVNLTQSGELGPTDVVTVVDDVDDDLVVLQLHDVNPDWTCVVDQPGNVINCRLDNNAGLTTTQEDLLFFDTCDTVTRGSVDNTADIFLNGELQNSDQANPDNPNCVELTATPTPTGTPATSTPTSTATPPTNTPTSTPTGEATSTPTSTPMGQATNTPTATPTSEMVATATPTPTSAIMVVTPAATATKAAATATPSVMLPRTGSGGDGPTSGLGSPLGVLGIVALVGGLTLLGWSRRLSIHR